MGATLKERFLFKLIQGRCRVEMIVCGARELLPRELEVPWG